MPDLTIENYWCCLSNDNFSTFVASSDGSKTYQVTFGPNHKNKDRVLWLKFLIPTKENEEERKLIQMLTEDAVYAEDMKTYTLSEGDVLRKKMLNINPKHIAAVEVIRC